jgi:hypothetical protein
MLGARQRRSAFRCDCPAGFVSPRGSGADLKLLSALIALPALVVGCAQRDFVVSFAADDVGRLPAGWTPLVTNGDVANTIWQVVADPSSPSGRCLALVRNENDRGQLNLCVCADVVRADLDLSAMCRGDFGVGLVWRCLDADNYYVCRVNPAEGNFNLYKVIAKKRTRLASARLHRFVDEKWYHVRVVASGDEITCYLDGHALITVRDQSLAEPGRIGVWTRADALGSFDRIEVKVNPAAAKEGK